MYILGFLSGVAFYGLCRMAVIWYEEKDHGWD